MSAQNTMGGVFSANVMKNGSDNVVQATTSGFANLNVGTTPETASSSSTVDIQILAVTLFDSDYG